MITTCCYLRDIPGGVTQNVSESKADITQMLLDSKTRELLRKRVNHELEAEVIIEALIDSRSTT